MSDRVSATGPVRTLAIATAAISVSISAASARAQSSPDANANTPQGSPAAAPAPPPAEPPAYTEARERQRRGRALLEARDYNAALAEFQRVYELLAGHPRRYMALSNIGRCYQSLGQYDRALEFYRRYLDEGGPQADDRTTVEAAITALEDLLGTLEITVQGPAHAEVWVDNRRTADAPGSVHVPGGRHVVEIRAEGFQPARREIQFSAHDSVPLRFTLQPVGHGLSPVVFGTGTALTVATAAAGGIVGAVALVTRSNIDAQSQDSTRRFLIAGEHEDRDPIRTEALAADVLFGTAAVFGVASVVVFFLTDFHASDAHPPTAPRASIVVAPMHDGDTTGACVRGVF